MARFFDRFYAALSVFRVVAVVATAAAFIGVQIAPAKTYVVHPSPYTSVHAYADGVEVKGGSLVNWVDVDDYRFECEIKEGVSWRYCGVSFKFFEFPLDDSIITENEDYAYGILQSIDLSKYEYLQLDAHYEGSAAMVRVFMRNAFKMPEVFDEHNQQKFLNETLSPAEMSSTIKIMLNEFSVADWWMAQFEKPRKAGVATFDKIFEIGIDFPGQPPLGKHTFSVGKITAVGDYVNKEAFYFGIIVLWLWIGLIEGGAKIAHLLRRHSHITNENTDLRELAQTDALTGLLNRHGVMPKIESLYPVGQNASIFLLMIDLDHFKAVNDQFGHDVGDTALVRAASALQAGVRPGDLLGRWGGEEFLIVCEVPDGSIGSFIGRLQSEIRSIMIKTVTGDLLLTMSVGVAKADVDESFEQTLKRADKAVFSAKAAGRNTWVRAD